MTPTAGDPRLTFALALVAGMIAQAVARHLRLPGIVMLLLAGVALGPDGLGWVRPREMGEGLFTIVDFAVAIILFEGGLNLEWSRLRRSGTVIRRLITWGALFTLFGGAIAAHVVLAWGTMESLLFGALVVVTGPTVVGPLVSELRLRPKVATVLEAEGVLIDPIGAILAVVILGLALSGDPGSLLLLEGGAGLARIAAGGVLGVAAGFVPLVRSASPAFCPMDSRTSSCSRPFCFCTRAPRGCSRIAACLRSRSRGSSSATPDRRSSATCASSRIS